MGYLIVGYRTILQTYKVYSFFLQSIEDSLSLHSVYYKQHTTVSSYKVLKIVYHYIASIINNTQLHSSVYELFTTVLCEFVLYCVCVVYVTRYA